jgi:hypothetical protein
MRNDVVYNGEVCAAAQLSYLYAVLRSIFLHLCSPHPYVIENKIHINIELISELIDCILPKEV